MDSMATSQVILPGQIVLNLWGVSQSMMEGLTLLGPPNCPVSWPASLVKRVSVEPTNKAVPVVPTTLAKLDTPLGSGKGRPPLGSSGKKSVPPKRVTDYWEDPERDKEDEESHRWEEERHQKKKPSGPVLSLDDVLLLTSKAVPSRVSQAPRLPTCAPFESKRGRSKVQWASSVPFNSSDDEPLSDKGGKLEPKSRKRDHSTPELMIVDDNDDDPLPGKPKGMGKKEKSRTYTQEELNGLDTLLLRLKSEALGLQYSMETAGLTKYHNDHVPSLRGAPNTDDHSAYLSKVKKVMELPG